MRFLDLARIQVRSGSGGSGAMSFRREKYVKFGGPDGGNGGNGGSVFVEAVEGLNTLIDFRYRPHVIAENGRPGRGQQRTGANGRGIVLQVPVGTEVLDEFQQAVMFDLVELGSRQLLLRGGNGGFGNRHFRSSTNQAPRFANQGQDGIERTFWLRLKMLADAGLLGLPNAGKSTLLSVSSNANPRVADFPYTTLEPMLGLVRAHDQEFVLADIPGLIEGAHAGKGIGIRFLGHVERCRVLLHLVDGTSEEIERDYNTVIGEIENYGHGIVEKSRMVVLTKIDALPAGEVSDRIARLEQVSGQSVFPVSAISGIGLDECWRHVGDAIRDVGTDRASSQVESAWTP